jgi:hypothetical protein
MSVFVHRGAASRIFAGGTAVTALYGPMLGGFITNPLSAAEQGLSAPELLYVDFVGTAALGITGTTFALFPGQTISIPNDNATSVSVNAASSGHKFDAIVIQPTTSPATPTSSTFPPNGPTTLLTTIPSYLYRQYADDEDLQAFIDSQNELQQEYLDAFNGLNLPIYPLLSGSLLDWVASGLYGMTRPTLSSGRSVTIGPFNTYAPNQGVVPFNHFEFSESSTFVETTDDVFKRILTWHFFKGDGQVFNVRWLKRRIARFLYGVDGVDYGVADTYDISVTFGIGGQVNIHVTIDAQAFKEAVDSGALELPFQYTWVVTTP